MKWLFALAVSFLVVFKGVPLVFAQEGPSLEIVTPGDETVVAGRAELQFSVDNFELTPRPSEDSTKGVIAIYLDGKFYTNTATTSATVQLGRLGTHRIDAELVNSSRKVVLPRVFDTVYVHNQRKLPYLYISNIRNGTTIYASRPTLDITSRIEQYEDQNTYYQVFVNGAVDGDSLETEDKQRYTVKQLLREGRNTIRVALYSENGKPYTPVVDHVVEVFYEPITPVLQSIDLLPDQDSGEIAFSVEMGDFSIPKDGYLLVKRGDTETSYASTSATLEDVPGGLQTLRFSLVDIHGFELIPEVSAEKTVMLGSSEPETTVPFTQQGIFTVGETGSTTRTGLLSLALLQAMVVVVLGVFFARQHSRHAN